MSKAVEITGDEDADYKLRLLIDTCVWLDIAKDYRQRPTIGAIEELVKAGVISLIVPRQVIEEFNRNKDRLSRRAGRASPARSGASKTRSGSSARTMAAMKRCGSSAMSTIVSRFWARR